MAATLEKLRGKKKQLNAMIREAERLASGKDYMERQRDASREWRNKAYAGVRDIAPIPDVADAARRESCRLNFQLFCETYCAAAFPMPWSGDHIKVIGKIETAVLDGGLFALAMPRGSGKTTLIQRAAVWALLYGHVPFVCLIGATEDAAQRMLGNLKTEFRFNDTLLADFPESVYPLRKLEGEARRCMGQTCGGRNTLVAWRDDRLTLPTIEGSAVSGATVSVAGITGSLRGQNHTLADGRVLRPALALLDDPQSRESAMSQAQSEARAKIIAGDVLGMAGPNRKIAALMACTVIRAGDMADRILDRSKHPQWQGERTKMVYAFPTAEKLWERYAELRAESFRKDGTGSEATEFYRENRAAMDEGAAVAWDARHNDDELSALQHAMNLKLRDEYAFYAEYQNEPKTDAGEATDLPSADDIAAKLSGVPPAVVPLAASHLTAFIDIQKTLLYYAVCAWSEDFTGWVIDYGAYPEQGVEYWLLREAKATLGGAKPGAGVEGAIFAGLTALADKLCGKQWKRDDGAAMKIDRCLIDANWGTSTDLVYDFCRASPHAAVLMPSHGRFIGASSMPMNQWTKKPGDRPGLNWQIQGTHGKRVIRHVVFDANYWKSFVFSRLATPMGDAGCLSLYGSKPGRHRMIADHLTAEYCVLTQGRGRAVSEWKSRPDRPDNHLLDCVVGCAAAASMQGAGLRQSERQGPADAPRKRISLAELQRKKRGY